MHTPTGPYTQGSHTGECTLLSSGTTAARAHIQLLATGLRIPFSFPLSTINRNRRLSGIPFFLMESFRFRLIPEGDILEATYQNVRSTYLKFDE